MTTKLQNSDSDDVDAAIVLGQQQDSNSDESPTIVTMIEMKTADVLGPKVE